VRRLPLVLAVLLFAAPLEAGAAKRDFIKALIAVQPFSPVPGVPPATTADVLLDGLNANVLEPYESFWLVEVHVDDAATLTQRGHAFAVEVRLHEDFDFIFLQGRLDARDGSGTLPPGESADPPYAAGVKGMWVLQFMGPVKTEWHAAVEAEGVTLVQPLAYNAYIAAATNETMQRVAAMRFVQWHTQMHRFLKPAIEAPPAGSYFNACVILATTDQTPAAIARLASASRVPIEVRPFSDEEVQIFGVFRAEELEVILAQPLVWGIAPGYHDANVADVPSTSFVALVVIAAALAAAAVVRLSAS